MSTLQNFYRNYWDFYLETSPTNATFLGYHQYDDKLPDISEENHEATLKKVKALYEELQKIAPETEADRINHQILSLTLAQNIESGEFYSHLIPVNPLTGFHIGIPQITDFHPFDTEKDIQNYFLRLEAFQRLVDQAIHLMEKGISLQVVSPKILIEKCLPQIESFLVDSAEESVFYLPLTQLKGFSEEEQKVFQEEGKKRVQEFILPAYKKLLTFMKDTYLPAGKEDVGLWSLPKGVEEYEYWIRYHTTTTLSAQEIHDIGWEELKKTHAEMEVIREKIQFSGTLVQMMEHLRTSSEFFYQSEEDLMEGFRAILRLMDTKLPQLFSSLPKTPYGLKQIEDYRAGSAPMAYYYPPAMDGSRPGYFYVNTSKLETRPKYLMEVLAYHEAVPGHHLQIALAQEMDMPEFRRMATFTGYVEGWGLYSEVLPKEVGLYQDIYSEFGRLIFDAWRSARLIVDTGLHAMKWTPEKAVQFCIENTGLTENEIRSEVNRYIGYPGQALSYKIGQLKILELRARAEKQLGSDFDIKEFHQRILENGSLPLTLLETFVDEWLASKLGS